jgi:hypothetical protein
MHSRTTHVSIPFPHRKLVPETNEACKGASVKLVGWSIIEPGMYLAAANCVRLRPVMLLVGRKLHIKSIYALFSKRILSTNNTFGMSNIRLDILSSSRLWLNGIDKEIPEGAYVCTDDSVFSRG